MIKVFKINAIFYFKKIENAKKLKNINAELMRSRRM